MKFPVRIKHRKQEAVIYGKTAAYPFYRLCYHVAGRRITKSLSSYAEVCQEAETKVRKLADGSHAPALSKRECASRQWQGPSKPTASLSQANFQGASAVNSAAAASNAGHLAGATGEGGASLGKVMKLN